ncbi:PTS sugar transporter subunit IIC [Alkalibacterium sp. s-m-22]
MSAMEKFTEIIHDVAVWVDDNKYLSAIKRTFTLYMPFVIVGSFSTLFNVLLSSPTTGLAQFSMFEWLGALTPAFDAMNFATLNSMSLAIPVILGAVLGQANKVNPVTSSVLALATYISVIPQSVEVVLEGASQLAAGLPVSAINASGLFVGMISTILIVELFSKLTNIDRLIIKMPPSVPAGITESFNVLIPIALTLIISSIAGQLFVLATGNYLNEYIYAIIQAPLEAIVQTPAGIIILVVLSQVFWLVGIHGGLIVSPVRNPLLIAALAQNINELNAGLEPSNPVTMGFWIVFMVVGGAGLTLSLIISLLLFSKNEDSKAIAKISLIPGLFGISEPIVFGLPLVLNPTFAIPFVFSSGIGTAIALFFNNIGFISPNTVDVPFGIPLGLNAFLGYGLSGVIVQLIILVVGIVCYIPFVLAENRIKPELEESK